MTPSETIDILAECAAEVYEDERNIWTTLPHEDKQRHRRVVKQVLETLRAITTKPAFVYKKPVPPALPYDPSDPPPDPQLETIVSVVCAEAGVKVEELTTHSAKYPGIHRARAAIAFILRRLTSRKYSWVEVANLTTDSGNEDSSECAFRRHYGEHVLKIVDRACARLGMTDQFRAEQAKGTKEIPNEEVVMDGRAGVGEWRSVFAM